MKSAVRSATGQDSVDFYFITTFLQLILEEEEEKKDIQDESYNL